MFLEKYLKILFVCRRYKMSAILYYKILWMVF